MTHALLYADKHVREKAEMAAAPNDCRFLLYFQTTAPEKKQVHSLTSHDAPSPPPTSSPRRCVFLMRHPKYCHSFYMYWFAQGASDFVLFMVGSSGGQRYLRTFSLGMYLTEFIFEFITEIKR